MKSSVNTCG